MKYQHEDILLSIAEEELKQKIEKSDSFELLGITYTMEEKLMFDDQVSFMLPKHFFLMEGEMLLEKYPSNDRPEIVFTNKTGSTNITFSLIETITEKKTYTN